MAQWAVVIPAERYETERLFHHDTLRVDDLDCTVRPSAGDDVVVVAGGSHPIVVALGRVPDDEQAAASGHAAASGRAAASGQATASGPARGSLLVAYTRRLFDAPQPAGGLPLDGPLSALDAATFRALVARLAPAADRRTWLVSLDLPIEADSPAEAVRLFWSYVTELGPAQLPAFVSPSGDELAMQAFVLGEQANQDPEEDD